MKKRKYKSNSTKKILLLFLAWRILITGIAIFSLKSLPLQLNFLGGGKTEYLLKPLIWGWANFDGEHYLAIAQNGYSQYQHFFFPVYPLLIDYISQIFSDQLYTKVIVGVVLSNLFFLLSLFGLYRYIRYDFNEKVALFAILSLILFPTSFYFGAVYTEALFFCLVIWFFVLMKEKKYFLATLLGLVASSTRIIGIVLFPVYIVELLIEYKRTKKINPINLVFGAIIPFGVILYMYYLFKTTGDSLIFFHNVAIFGEQRSSNFIILPQVYYRYIFKIFPHLSLYLPMVFTTLLEFSTSVVFLALIVVVYLRRRLSETLFMVGGFIIPTLSGSFSSLPRYVLVLFPGFIIVGLIMANRSKLTKIIVFTFLLGLLLVAESFFFRGYWIS